MDIFRELRRRRVKTKNVARWNEFKKFVRDLRPGTRGHGWRLQLAHLGYMVAYAGSPSTSGSWLAVR